MDREGVKTKRFGSLSGLATGHQSSNLAAQRDPSRPADYSAAGWENETGEGVDAAAIVETSSIDRVCVVQGPAAVEAEHVRHVRSSALPPAI